MVDFVIKKGDRLPRLRIALTDSAGDALDLTGAAVTFRMKLRGATSLKVIAAASVVAPATGGIVEYTWGANDTNAVGVYDAEVVVSYVGETQTVPSSGYVAVIVASTLA